MQRWQLLPLLALALPLPAPGAEPTATVIEFHNAALDHYFITAAPEEAAALDRGDAIKGWTRTGVRFSAWAGASDDASALPVCRFFGTPGQGPNTHFYTADAAECAALKAHPAWTYEGVAFHLRVPGPDGCPAGTVPVYRSFQPGKAVADSNHRYLPDLTLHYRMAATSVLEGVAMCAPRSTAEVEADVVRLLRQATWGPTAAEVERVKGIGAEAFVEEQLAQPATPYPGYPFYPAVRPDTCVNDTTLPVRADSYCQRDNYTLFQLQREFFAKALAGKDQLRQRVAFALSQILVVSGSEINHAYGMREYQQLLSDLAFDNYERILTEVTLSPAMGRYLDMVNNRKPDATAKTEPNENYARELLQLFAIGTQVLDSGGRPVLDAQGRAVPTYGNDEIEGFAHVFTGWTYPTQPGQQPRNTNPLYYLGRMEERPALHDTAAKSLLGGEVLPAGQTMGQDLAGAIRNVFNHPNVGPFVARALIQKLVTSDPTPQYVARVAARFADNGAGVRGDMKALLRAVLLDPEARGDRKLDPAYGKLREPALYLLGIARALDARSDGVWFRGITPRLGQGVFQAPSVFNFYPPDYVVPGTDLLGPEFGLQTTNGALDRINAATTLLFTAIAPDATVYGATGTQLDWTRLQALAGDSAALVDEVDRLLLQRTLSAAARQAIVGAVNAVSAGDSLNRARTAVFLVVSSSQYQVER